MKSTESQHMTDNEYRSLLTKREREIISGEADVSRSYYYRVVSRIRDKIEGVEKDLAVLEEHDTLADELREVVWRRGGRHTTEFDITIHIDYKAAGIEGSAERGKFAQNVMQQLSDAIAESEMYSDIEPTHANVRSPISNENGVKLHPRRTEFTVQYVGKDTGQKCEPYRRVHLLTKDLNRLPGINAEIGPEPYDTVGFARESIASDLADIFVDASNFQELS